MLRAALQCVRHVPAESTCVGGNIVDVYVMAAAMSSSIAAQLCMHFRHCMFFALEHMISLSREIESVCLRGRASSCHAAGYDVCDVYDKDMQNTNEYRRHACM